MLTRRKKRSSYFLVPSWCDLLPLVGGSIKEWFLHTFYNLNSQALQLHLLQLKKKDSPHLLSFLN